jgi:glucose-1-phosphate cytidylyltransferase
MKVVILAGGFGTRLAEETDLRPKPLVEIGGKPILWHVMKIYEVAGLNEFIICCGYKGQLIKNYFVNYFTENYDITVNLEKHDIAFLGHPSEKWKVTLVDTGIETLTGGRIRRIASYIGGETFCLTYGDGLARIDVRDVVRFHRAHGRKATVTAVPSPGRFGILDLAPGDHVRGFREKPNNEMGWINGGFFVCEPSVLEYIDGDSTMWERAPLERLSGAGELMAYPHKGFWRAMDTLRDKRELEELWARGRAPWKIW